MKVLGCGVLVVALVGCMPPQENSGKVKSFDANACVDWDNLKKDYGADLSLINVHKVNLGPNTNPDGTSAYLSVDKSKTAQLAVLTISSSTNTPYVVKEYDGDKGNDDQAATDSKLSERLRVEDIFIKQIGSDKPVWDLQGLTDVNTPRSYQGTDPLQNLDLAVKMHIKAMIKAMIDAQEKFVSDEQALDDIALTKHLRVELKRGTSMAHYAGTSTDHEGTSEVHLIVGRGVPTQDDYHHGLNKQEGGRATEAKDKYEEEALDTKDNNQAVSPALLTLFHNGNAYMSDFPAAAARSEELDGVETLMPGVLNKIASKYFFGAACGGGGDRADDHANGR